MANVPISSLGWKKVSYSTLKSVWFRNGSLRQRWAATCGGWHLTFSGGKKEEWRVSNIKKRKKKGELTCKYPPEPDSGLCNGSNPPLPFPPPRTPLHIVVLACRRIRRQHGGGGAKASSSWLRPHHAAIWCGDSSRLNALSINTP